MYAYYMHNEKKKTAFAEPRPLISLCPNTATFRGTSQSVPQLINIRVSKMARKIYTICSRSNGLNGHAQKSIAQKHTGNAMITTHWSSCLCLKTKAGRSCVVYETATPCAHTPLYFNDYNRLLSISITIDNVFGSVVHV